ncbi:MAG: hypothetical protein V4760_08045, partial [Bdellovibrionota bacterium]
NMSRVAIANAKTLMRLGPGPESIALLETYTLTPAALSALRAAKREVELERGAQPTITEKLKYSIKGGVPAPSCQLLFLH